MKNGGILPQDEWLAKHKLKFDREGLPKSERLRRYRDYASSSAASAELNPRQHIARAPKTGVQKGQTDRAELIKAMIDPFTACSADGYLPRIPDGTLRSTGVFKFKFNVDVFSNAEGRAFFFLTNSPFRCFVASQTTSNVVGIDADYVSQCEYNAYAAATSRLTAGNGDMPPWSADGWSIPTVLTKNDGVTDPSIGFQPASGYTSLLDLAQAWRPLCMGMKFSNTSRATNRQGSVAVARWPGALGTPCIANQLLVVQGSASNGATLAGYEGQGPNYTTVQTLPTAEVIPVTEGYKAVWAPESTEGQAIWRPTHPKPYCSAGTITGLEQFSDTTTTGVLILPSPCNANADRYGALIDRIYTQNANVGQTAALVDNSGGTNVYPRGYGELTGLYFQSWEVLGPGTAASNDTITSYAMRDIMHGYNESDLLPDDTALVAVFEGCEPSTLIGTMEVVLGVEYIADSRVVSAGNGPRLEKVSMTKSKQLDVHHATISAMSTVPAVVARGPDIMGEIASGVGKVAGVVTTVAPYVEMALSALGALL